MSLSNLSSLSIFFLSFLLHFPSLASSFNISQVLSQYPSFSTFSNYLAQTQLVADIDSRQTITILAVDNAGISPLSGRSMDVIKKVLTLHVLLDYFDVPKLQNLNNKTTTVTTMFQTTGQATGQEGFIKITDMDSGAISFTSVSDGAVGANLVQSVASEPYNLSVIQVSTVIIPSALLVTSPSSSPKPAPVQSPVPVRSPVPVVSPVPVRSPVPVVSPVPVRSPVPVVSPVPVRSPVPVISPVPVRSPVPAISPVPVRLPVPATSPVPARAPEPASSPEPEESPEESPASSISEGPGPSPMGAVADKGNSGATIDMTLAILITFLWSIYMQ